jgi:hypothetical protein
LLFAVAQNFASFPDVVVGSSRGGTVAMSIKSGSEDRATWRDHLMQMEGVEPKQQSALHGELIAFDWIEQNTGANDRPSGWNASACYRAEWSAGVSTCFAEAVAGVRRACQLLPSPGRNRRCPLGCVSNLIGDNYGSPLATIIIPHHGRA